MTNLELNKTYTGFTVTTITPIEEVGATAYEMTHSFSGAKLLFLATPDDNKVFTIGFRTPSTDDTGIAHIMEHSVLCGSQKYQLKEPFVELVKGSMNTFLNAMTYADKTVYPVASRNDKDFHNLMDVYLDAVFNPLIHSNSYTLKQEGWHYELDTPEGELSYNGVVYNEMKGVYSSADAVWEHETYKALFPDTTYHFESGGYPAAIPSLTQEQFSEFHRTHYVPENAYIYLYGNVDILSTLAYLDQAYLSKYPCTGKCSFKVEEQAPFQQTKEVLATYPIPEGESTAAKTYLSLDIVTGNVKDVTTTTALRVLETVLLEGNDSPLRLALLAAGIGSDISGSFATSQLQPVFSIKVGGSESAHRDKFIHVVYKTLQELTLKGINKKLLEAALNVMEFKLREADFGAYPKGLIYGLACYDVCMYDESPITLLQSNKVMAFLRAQLKTNYFEQLIEQYLMDNAHKVIVCLTPEPGKEEREAAEATQLLAEIKAKMSPEELAVHAAEAKKLHELQARVDSPEQLAHIPLLDRTDIRREIELEKYEVVEQGEQELLYLPQFTNKISYMNWYYDLSGVAPSELPYLYLLTDVLGKMNTSEFSYQELSTYTNEYTGGIDFQITPYALKEDAANYTIRFFVGTKALDQNIDKVFKLLRNIGASTDFSDAKRLQEIIEEVKTSWDSAFFNRGLSVASARLGSYYSPIDRVTEQDYLSYYQFLKKLTANLAEALPTVQAKLQQHLHTLFHSSKQLFAYSCAETEREHIVAQLAELTSSLPASSLAGAPIILLEQPGHNEGIITAGKVQYVTAGGNYKQHGFEYTGAMRVLSTILRYEYLWTKIRVQGGAYGAGAVFDRLGNIRFTSYRDPNLQSSLAAYKALPEYLASFDVTDREMTKYVIGTISGMDTPLTNSMHLVRAANMHLAKLAPERLQLEREQVLDITQADIKALSPLVAAVLADNNICVVGGSAKITEAKALFDTVIKA